MGAEAEQAVIRHVRERHPLDLVRALKQIARIYPIIGMKHPQLTRQFLVMNALIALHDPDAAPAFLGVAGGKPLADSRPAFPQRAVDNGRRAFIVITLSHSCIV